MGNRSCLSILLPVVLVFSYYYTAVFASCGGNHKFTSDAKEYTFVLNSSLGSGCIWSFESFDYHDIHVVVNTTGNVNSTYGTLPTENRACSSSDRVEFKTPANTKLGVICEDKRFTEPITKKLFNAQFNSAHGPVSFSSFSITLKAVPYYDLQCKSNEFELSMPLARLDSPVRYPYENYHLRHRTCQATQVGNVLRFSGGYSQCGSSFSEEPLGYGNAVVMEPKTGGISRPSLNMPIFCKTTLKDRIVSQSYNLVSSPSERRKRSANRFEAISNEGSGLMRAGGVFAVKTVMNTLYGEYRLDVSLNVYDNDEFHVDGQRNMWSNLLYFEVTAPSAPADMVIAAQSCWISPTNDPTDPNNFALLKNGCPSTDDSIERYPSDNHNDRFAIEAIDLNSYSGLHHIHCILKICQSEENCNKTCVVPRVENSTIPVRRNSSITGTVVDAVWGHPLRYAEVVLISKSNESTNGTDDLKTLTSHDGSYFFERLASGDYTVTVDIPGYKGVMDVSITLDGLTFLELLQVNSSATVSGVITTPWPSGYGDEPVEGVSVEFHADMEPLNGQSQRIYSTRTDWVGRYFVDLEPGNYMVELYKDGYMKDSFFITVLDGGQIVQNAVIIKLTKQIILTCHSLEDESIPIYPILDMLEVHMVGPDGQGGTSHVISRGFEGGNSHYTPNYTPDMTLVGTLNSEGSSAIILNLYKQYKGIYRYTVKLKTDVPSIYGPVRNFLKCMVQIKDKFMGQEFIHIFDNNSTSWTVFELDGDNVLPIDKMERERDDGNMNYPDGQYPTRWSVY